MKFAEDLTENLVPEWKDKYLDYKAGKKKIKQITNTPTISSAAGNAINKLRSYSRSDDVFGPLPPAAITPELAPVTDGSPPDSKKYDDRTPLLQSVQRLPHTNNTQFEHFPDSEERAQVIRRNTTRTNNSTPNGANSSSVPLQSFRETAEMEFTVWLDQELEKIDAFYKMNEDNAVQRFLLLQDQLYHLRADKDKLKAKNERNELIKKSIQKTTRKLNKYELPSLPDFHFRNSRSSLEEEHNGHLQDYEHHYQDIPYYVAKRQLKTAVQEFYRGLELLKSYRALNRTAFRKLVKKFDKKSKSSLSLEYMEKVNASHFASSDTLDNLIPKIEEIYSATFEHGNRKIAVEKLRSNLQDEVFYSSTFLSGLFYGLSVPLLIYAIYLGIKTLEDSVSKEVKFILQIWAGFFLLILMMIMFALNCYIWSKYKVNYKFIFEFNQHDCLNSKQIHLIPSFLLFGCSLFAWFSFNNFWPGDIPSRDWPWFFFGFAMIVLFFPFDVFYLSARRWLIIVIWRLLFSGFYPVEFKDFFLGDILCSLTYTMGNISFFFCVYINNWKDADIGDPVCGSSRSRLMGFFAALPAVWRCLQCLRRYFDSGEWFPHLANTVKYGISIAYYAMLSVYRINRSETNRGIFILVATANSIFSGLWDIFMDWSLMQDSTMLRKKLVFPRWFYYAAISSDITLRFQWIFYALFSQQIQQSAMTSFFIAIAEIVRRFIWLIIRMENEHIANLQSYRASREVRLPYDTIIRDGNSMMSRTQSAHSSTAPRDQEEAAGMENISGGALSTQHSAFQESTSSIKRRGTVLNSSVFQNVTKAIVNAHAKDFQRRKADSDNLENNSSDEDNSDGES